MTAGGDRPATTNEKSSEAPLVGRLVSGKYQVLELVATGGMGRIYKAEQHPLGRIVALKTLISEAIHPRDAERTTPSGAQFKQRFFREASVLAKLQHPNLVTVFDYGKIEGVADSDDEYYMAMEFLTGETLSDRLARKVRLSAAETIEYMKQMAMGLRAAHALGVVHRDLKPSNVMLGTSADGVELLKILDFGIIKLLNATENPQELTQEGVFVGSPRYMAPEQIVAGAIDVRADIYSLGIIGYQLLTGNTPFHGETAIQTMMSHVNLPVPPMRSMYKEIDVPDWLEELIEKCLEKEAQARPQTMDEVLDTLRMGAGGTSSVALRVDPYLPDSLPERASGSRHNLGQAIDAETAPEGAASRPSHRHLSRWLAAGMLGMLALGGLNFVRKHSESNARTPSSSSPAALATPAAFNFRIESEPPGADVIEDTESLGRTPLQLQIRNADVDARARHLTLRREGFDPYVVIRGPSPVDIVLRAVLAPSAPPVTVPAQPTSSPPSSRGTRPGNTRQGTGPAAPRPSPSQSPSPASSQPDDLRFTR